MKFTLIRQDALDILFLQRTVYGSTYDNFPMHRIFDKGIIIRQGHAPVLNYIDHLIDLVKEEKVVLDDILPIHCHWKRPPMDIKYFRRRKKTA